MTWRVLPFAQARFDRRLFALCRETPLLEHLLCWMEARHGRPVDARLRPEPLSLALAGSFPIRLPAARATLQSGRAVMLPDKTTVFGIQRRPDLLVAASRVGHGHPLTAVLLPRARTILPVCGTDYTVTPEQAAQALALFASHGADWAAPLGAARLRPLVVTGDRNYAHHLWNQLGALRLLLERAGGLDIAVTHQPIGNLHDIFHDMPGLRVHPVREERLVRLDPRRVLPFCAGGQRVLAHVRAQIASLATAQATDGPRAWLARMQAEGRRPVWVSLRLDRSARNQFVLLRDLIVSLLSDGAHAVVLDGWSIPYDYAVNPDYDRGRTEEMIAREQELVGRLLPAVEQRAPTARELIWNGVGGGLPDALFLAQHCRAYFANHGTLQHKIGYFTRVPGLVHGNAAALATDAAGAQRHVNEDAGPVAYLDAALIEDVPGPHGAMHPGNDYRFTDVAAVIAAFRAFLARCPP